MASGIAQMGLIGLWSDWLRTAEAEKNILVWAFRRLVAVKQARDAKDSNATRAGSSRRHGPS
ncbi:hypothetical protein IAQ61_010160 [Plenodomus lingam]|uniref:uncharacterized protein n=1 Tax=Leptosphaeria maculans TaxID=5022 RepID=UPI003327DDF5|nr:hypothetical protein IAQ61_010160 [Plenodomus lingam]